MADDEIENVLADAYISACRQEVEALKPGNVHVFAGGHGMEVEQFLVSARVSARPLTQTGAPVGKRVLRAVQATRAAVGVNTNLGIILLCAPLLAAAERVAAEAAVGKAGSLRAALAGVLAYLGTDDARDVFAAIVHAGPGGLGEAEHDVRQPPRVSLLEAMRQAGLRDSIAKQYASGFGDVVDIGLTALDSAVAQGETGMYPCVIAYLSYLAAMPDSHVARKWGQDSAETISAEARKVLSELRVLRDDNQRKALLLAFDGTLKARGINPGTSADLTVACLLVRDLRDNLHIAVDDA